MATVLKLGFKDNPTIGSDDAIDLISAGSSTGYFLKPGMNYGSPKLDTTINRLTRILTVPLEVRGSTIDDANSKLRTLYRYVEQTEVYFARFGGNIPARSDGAWHQGNAAVLTEQASGASYMVYWNVLGGDVAVSEPLGDVTVTNKAYQVTLALVVEAAARGDRVVLNNYVPYGDFAPPFAVGTTYYQGGWAFSAAAKWSVSSTFARYGQYSLKWTDTASSTATSGAVTLPASGFDNTEYLLLDFYVRGSITSGTCTVGLQTQQAGVYADRVTVTLTSADNTALGAGWVRKTAASSYQMVLADTAVQLKITTPTNGTLYFDAVAIWRLPTNTTTPPTEYLASGGVVGMPNMTVYNVQGDTIAPAQLNLEDRSSTVRLAMVAGGQAYDSSFDAPLKALDFDISTGATAATNFYGKLGRFDSGAATSSTYQTTGLGLGFDGKPRLYRVFLEYAANNNTGITAVQVQFGIGGSTLSKTFTQSLPQTYALNSNATASDYRIWELGDLWFPSISTATLEQQCVVSSVGVVLTHSNNANRFSSVAGLILVPTEQYGTVYHPGNTGSMDVIFSNEGSAPKPAAFFLGSNTKTPIDLTYYNTAASFKGGNFTLRPANSSTDATRYEILFFKTRDSTYSQLYTFDASDVMRAYLKYSPRYTMGVR